MRLLIVTQAVDQDDQVLGFFHEWIATFAQHTSAVQVVCLREGRHALPRHVSVHALPSGSRLRRSLSFLQYLWTSRRSFDAVLVHMNPEYLVIAGLLLRFLGIPTGLWHAHQAISWRLKLATRFATVIFTPSPESFRLRSRKVVITGHGIPLHLYPPHAPASLSRDIKILTVGRIARVKRLDVMLEMVRVLRGLGHEVTFNIIGDALTQDDVRYKEELEQFVRTESLPISFLGAFPHAEIPALLRRAHVFVNASETGSLDKAILEAWMAGLFVVSTNEGVRTCASSVDPSLPYPTDSAVLARAIASWAARSEAEREAYRVKAREYVEHFHSLALLCPKILARLAHNRDT